MGLKLLALKVETGSNKKISKILANDEFFCFDSNYRYNSERKIFYRKTDSNPDYENFYYANEGGESSLREININAIVGKNGEGKSSLIDVLLAFLNNFNFCYLRKDKNLLFIPNINGELHFSVNSGEIEKFYKIMLLNELGSYVVKLSGEKETYFKAVCDNDVVTDYVIENKKFNFNEILFFTLGINYSLYGWNSTYPSYITQGKSWLKRIFHKNDGYYVPLSLHPYRERGQIDINKELFLANQRLLGLSISQVYNGNHFKLNDSQEFNKLEISDLNYNNQKLKNLVKEIADDFVSDTVIGMNVETNKYDGILNYLISNGEELYRLPNNFRIYNSIIGVFDYDEFFSLLKKVKNNLDDIDLLSELKLKLKNLEFQRIFLIITIYEIEKYVSKLIDHHERNLLLALFPNVEKKLLNYIIYKIILISKTYPKYQNRLDFSSKNINVKILNIQQHIQEIWSYINDLFNDESHITLKMFQSLNFLTNYRNISNYQAYTNLFEKFLREKNNSINLLSYNNFFKSSSFNSIGINRERMFMEFLPPTIFRPRLKLHNKQDNTHVYFDDLSSGQIQLINTVGTVLYHLKNIDSVSSDGNELVNKYRHVNIILDEIELYFHPEFQRTFVNYLLESLSKIHFSNIESLNFIFVTHSPFILTDVPKNKVIFLEKGRQVYPMDDDTFGANIHSLLQHGFFLNSVPIGEFAKKKINEYFSLLHEGKTKILGDKDLLPYLLDVGEPFIKSQLLKMYHDLKGNYNIELEKKLNYMEQQIEDLKRRIND